MHVPVYKDPIILLVLPLEYNRFWQAAKYFSHITHDSEKLTLAQLKN